MVETWSEQHMEGECIYALQLLQSICTITTAHKRTKTGIMNRLCRNVWSTSLENLQAEECLSRASINLKFVAFLALQRWVRERRRGDLQLLGCLWHWWLTTICSDPTMMPLKSTSGFWAPFFLDFYLVCATFFVSLYLLLARFKLLASAFHFLDWGVGGSGLLLTYPSQKHKGAIATVSCEEHMHAFFFFPWMQMHNLAEGRSRRKTDEPEGGKIRTSVEEYFCLFVSSSLAAHEKVRHRG